MKTPAEWAAYVEGLERCIAAQTDREMDLRWQLASIMGQLKQAQAQAGAFCHRAMQLEQQLTQTGARAITIPHSEFETVGGNHG